MRKIIVENVRVYWPYPEAEASVYFEAGGSRYRTWFDIETFQHPEFLFKYQGQDDRRRTRRLDATNSANAPPVLALFGYL